MIDRIQIYILSRDRPIFLEEMIDSLLNQNQAVIQFEIIVSDNSVGDDVENMIAKRFSMKDFKYIKRRPSLSSRKHFQLIVSELKEKYAILLHDDDILHPDYIKEISCSLKDKGVVAIGCNAFIFSDDIQKIKLKMHKSVKSKRFNNEKDFLERYLPGGGGIAPFPGYLYQTEYLKKVFLKVPIKGKHSDVAILSSLLNYGSILWLESPLMYYRRHESNDSVVESIPDRLQLLNYMKSKGINKKSTGFLLFRIIFWLNWVLQQGRFLVNITHWRYRTVVLSILLKIMKISMTRNFWKILFLRYKMDL